MTNMRYEDGFWTGKIELPVWNEIFPNAAEIEVSVGGDEMTDQILPIHETALRFLQENQGEILVEILNSLFSYYPQLQEDYGYDEEEKEEFMPDVHDIRDFVGLVTPTQIHLLNVEVEGVGYVGYQFQCSWDEEHELGIMTHKTRVVEIGDEDSAFLSWIAEEDRDNL